ncbi:hypothetical protein PM082_001220 [Marasmius tenuissimus]|nr:hypothetical protein PM082_001220 [Marasmius tenuissimus]
MMFEVGDIFEQRSAIATSSLKPHCTQLLTGTPPPVNAIDNQDLFWLWGRPNYKYCMTNSQRVRFGTGL